jgi:anhydro-N-acetylmuramic acid kinase
MNKSLTVVGLISGTSADAIDAVLVQTDGESAPQVLTSLEYPYPEEIRKGILSLYTQGQNEIERMGKLDMQIGEQFAQAALAVIKQGGLQPHQVDLIGSHGQTIRHRPPFFTLQIGNGFAISALTGITTVADFRPADLLRGGEGAPLTPLFHRILFQKEEKSIAIVNLGGIANITALPVKRDVPLCAGDSGPANSLVDLLAERLTQGHCRCDHDGFHASQGKVIPEAMRWLKSHPYFSQSFPKSTGREIFGADYLDEVLQRFPLLAHEDGYATLTQFTVDTVAEACCQLLDPYPEDIILCGGGSANPEMVRRLKIALPASQVYSSTFFGVDPYSLEAQAFAWFAVRTFYGLPSSLPQATGAKEATILGALFPGSKKGVS